MVKILFWEPIHLATLKNTGYLYAQFECFMRTILHKKVIDQNPLIKL